MMNPEMWEKVTAIYHSALELEPVKRENFLDERCADDEFLRREIESLLLADGEAGSFIAEPVFKDVAPFLNGENEPSLVGAKLGGYRILSRIGAGGMGEVYLAEDERLHRSVAVKTLPAGLSNHPNYLRRFEIEAKAISALNHPNILTIYEIGEADGVPFLVTEFIAGETLRARLGREKTLDLREIIEIAVQVVSALGSAHEKGIVHRDIKPENIMLRDDGLVKILDFGLVKLLKTPPENGEKAETDGRVKTAAGVILGTVAYMSPEQTRAKPLDARTDIWSFGICLYEMLAGNLPFDGETTNDRIAAILKSELPDGGFPSQIPVKLKRVVEKCLIKDCAERYENGEALLPDLREIRYELEFAAKQENLATKEMRHGDAELETRRRLKARSENENFQAVSGGKPSSGAIKRQRSAFESAVIILILAICAFSVFIFYQSQAAVEKDDFNSIAVMPFVNENGSADTEYLSDGISENLINNLSRLPKLKVIARSSSFKYKNKNVDLDEVRRALGVETVLSGRVSQRDENLQISVELINANDKTQIWGEQYNRRKGDLQALQAEIMREIAQHLRKHFTNGERGFIGKNETVNPAAYELVLKGRLFRSRGGADNRRQAIEYFQQATEIDPHYALAYAEMSEGFRSLINNRLADPKQLVLKVQWAAQKAVELDETLPEAHFALASAKRLNWQWQDAEREYRRAIELNPNYANAYNGYAVYLSVMNRHDEAVAEVKHARHLDPLSLLINANVGYTYYFARRYDEAIEFAQKAVELDPGFATAHSILASALAARGRYREAVAAYEKAIKSGGSNSGLQIHLGEVLARGGEKNRAAAILNRLESSKDYVSPAELAILYSALGKNEQALVLLEKAFAEQDLSLQHLAASPSFDDLRPDSRFQDLLRRIGLPR